MNKEQILSKIKKYLAHKYECDISYMNKQGLNIIKNDNNRLKMLLFYDLILVSTPTKMYDDVCKQLQNKNTYEVFEFPYTYGQSIYYIPDIDRVTKQKEIDKYTFKLFDGNTNEINLSTGFLNALTFKDNECISDMAYVVYKDGQVIGAAGADKVTDDIWEVGIEILPEYRKGGLATILTSNLTRKILEKGIVPIWCASVSNIGSQAVAYKSNYIPLWMETYSDIFDGSYVFKELILREDLYEE